MTDGASGTPGRRVMISCGEASGDMYAGALVRALQRQAPGTTAFGFGGAGLADAGATLIGDYHGFSVTGLTEAFSVLRKSWKMLVIFPFEKPLYDDAGVPAEFVGHPLIDLAVAGRSRDETCRDAGLDAARPVVALLPGSRPNELRLLLPRLVGAASKLVHDVPGVQFLVARAPALDDSLFAPLEHLRLSQVPIGVLSNAADDVLAASDIVITASGTATVQTALHQRPMVIVYRVSPMTYALLKPFMQVASYGMVNLVAGRPVVAELIQDGCTPEAIAREGRSLLTDRERAQRMRHDLAEVVHKLGGPGASERAAAAVLAACR